MRIVVLGLGYVGLPVAAGLAERGHDVVGIDLNRERVEAAQAGRAAIYEPGLDPLLERGLASGQLTVMPLDDVESPLPADVALIATGTPARADGTADLRAVREAIRWARTHLAGTADTAVTTIAVKSSVPPGSARALIADELDGAADRYVSVPEFLRQGAAVADFLAPQRVIVGGSDAESMTRVAALFEVPGTPTLRTDVTTAELIKYASNAFLVTKISFANEMAMICDLVGADIEETVEGMALDQRIGGAYLGAGVGWGGSCFPKDVRALHLIGESGPGAPLLNAAVAVNERQMLLPYHALLREFGSLDGVEVALLGLAFKPGTDDIRDAPALVTAPPLVAAGAKIRAYDPLSNEAARDALPAAVRIAADPLAALDGAQAVILMTEWPQFVALPWAEVAGLMREPRVVFDGRNALPAEALTDLGFRYIGVGRGRPAADRR